MFDFVKFIDCCDSSNAESLAMTESQPPRHCKRSEAIHNQT
ncbi:hypothetical protein [Helicobacter sp.]|nr:hypothetical protein [Helicobacter sp.]MDY5557477.1 hypothetical protein [Helicobacter sp.]